MEHYHVVFVKIGENYVPAFEVLEQPTFTRCDSKTGEPIYKMEVKKIE